MSLDWAASLLAFWFGLDPSRHFAVDAVLDADIDRRFRRLWETERSEPDDRFLSTPDHALAAVVLFDQVPRNIFRGDRRSFATDAKARAIADAAIARGFDLAVAPERRHFLYLPFEHSEALADQERCCRLMQTLGNDEFAAFAVKHRDVIVRFGRFPHRNAVLGRQSTEEELEFGLEQAW